MKTLRTPTDLVEHGLLASDSGMNQLASRYAVAVPPAMAALIDRTDPNDPIARQVVPNLAELDVHSDENVDPIGDDAHSPVEGIVHRYPDRVLLKLVHVCAVYCRFCFRREMVGPGKPNALSKGALESALGYIKSRPDIWEVILTGGDPLVLSPRRLREVMKALAAIDHVKVVRIHTRVPVADPAADHAGDGAGHPAQREGGLCRASRQPCPRIVGGSARSLRSHDRCRHSDGEPDGAVRGRQRQRHRRWAS